MFLPAIRKGNGQLVIINLAQMTHAQEMEDDTTEVSFANDTAIAIKEPSFKEIQDLLVE